MLMLARTGVPVEVPAAPRERPDGRRQRGGEPPAVHADPHLLDGSCPGPGPAGESYTTAVHVSSAAEEVGNTRRDHEGTDPDTRYPGARVVGVALVAIGDRLLETVEGAADHLDR